MHVRCHVTCTHGDIADAAETRITYLCEVMRLDSRQAEPVHGNGRNHTTIADSIKGGYP